MPAQPTLWLVVNPDLHTSVAELQSSILLTTRVSISFMYFSLNVWIIPRSRGWSLEVQFGGKNNLDVVVFAFHI